MPAGTSIGRRLASTIFLTSGIALALACVAFLAFDVVSLRREMLNETRTLAEVIGLNTADALRFRDPAAAELVLRSLRAAPQAIAAAVYDDSGELFSSYARDEAGHAAIAAAPAAGGAQHDFTLDHVDLYQPLVLDGERLGTIHVRFDTRRLARRVEAYAVIVAVLLVAVFGVSRFIARGLRDRVAQPLAELARGAAAIAEGQLATRASARGDAEIQKLGSAFNDMAAGLGELVARVREDMQAVTDVAQSLSSESERMSSDVLRQEQGIDEAAHSVDGVAQSLREVNQNVEHLADRARETSSAILEMDTSTGEVASHMDRLAESLEEASSGTSQMAASVRTIGTSMESLERSSAETAGLLEQMVEALRRMERNATQSSELSQEASAEAGRGMRAVEGTTDAMTAIRDSFDHIEGSVRGLAEKSDAIGEILRVIENVVEQTNMLALNAAIIAAQAGEHGKGFSVVSDEIKTLAERTARSTREIASLIESVQRETSRAVGAVEVGSQTVETGVARSAEAGEVLRAIMEKVDTTARQVGEIVEAAARQTRDMRGVESAMARVRELAVQTSRSTHENEQVGSEIAQSVEQIRELGLEVKRSTTEQSRQSGLMTRAVEDVASGVNQILQATQSQSSESEKISRVLAVFREVAEGSARRAEAFHQIVEDLAQRSERLKAAIDRFDT